MSIIKIKKTANYTIVDNSPIKDCGLSWQSKGLLTYLMSLPDNWIIRKTELHNHAKNGRDSTIKAFNELRDAGYIIQQESEGTKFGFDYIVSDKPLLKTRYGNSVTENQTLLSKEKVSKDINPIVDSNECDDIRFQYQSHFFEIAEYWKEITGDKWIVPTTKTRMKTYGHYKNIKARLNKGATISQIKTVIKYCFNKWHSDEYMRQFIRTETLFGGKFDQYLENAINRPSAKSDNNEPQDLEQYILTHYREKDLKHMKNSGRFQTWETQLKENSFKLTNIAKGYKNKTFTPLFVFEAAFMPLGKNLSGSNDIRKLESLERWYKKLSDYQKNQGNMRELLKDWSKQQAI